MLIRDKLKPKTPIRSSAPTLDELALLAMQGSSSPVAVDNFGMQSAIGNPDSFPIQAFDKSIGAPFVGISGAPRASRIERSADPSLPLGGTGLPSLDESALLLRNQISETDDPVSKALLNNREQENLANSPSANGPRPASEPMGGFIATAQGSSRSGEAERPKTTLELDKRSAACDRLISLIYDLDEQKHDGEAAIQAAEARVDKHRKDIESLSRELMELSAEVPDGVDRGKGHEKLKVKDAADKIRLVTKIQRIGELESQIRELVAKLEAERTKLQELKRLQGMTERNLSQKREELGRLDCNYADAEVDHLP